MKRLLGRVGGLRGILLQRKSDVVCSVDSNNVIKVGLTRCSRVQQIVMLLETKMTTDDDVLMRATSATTYYCLIRLQQIDKGTAA